MHSVESKFVMGPSNVLFAGVYVGIFQPGIFLQAVKELITSRGSVFSSSVKYIKLVPILY